MKRLIILAIFVLMASQGVCEEADQNILDFNIAGFGQKGEKAWEVKAKSADIFTDTINLSQIEAVVFGKDEDMNLTADRGSYDKSKGAMHVESNVVATTTGGARLTSNSLDWSEGTQSLSSQDFVRVQRDTLLATAEGMEAKPGLKNIELKRDVTVQISQKEDSGQNAQVQKPTIITCDGPLEINYEERVATFNNNVKVEHTEGEIYSDSMDVYFDSLGGQETVGLEQTKIKKIVSRGNVKIVQGQNTTYSQEAVYTSDDKKVVLTGRPKLIIYSAEDFKNVITGD